MWDSSVCGYWLGAVWEVNMDYIYVDDETLWSVWLRMRLCVSPDSRCFTPLSFRTPTSGICHTTSVWSSIAGGSSLKSPSWWRWRVGEWCFWNNRNRGIIVEDPITSLLHWLPNSYLHDCAHLHAGRAAWTVFDTVKADGINAKKQYIYNISNNLKMVFYLWDEIQYF